MSERLSDEQLRNMQLERPRVRAMAAELLALRARNELLEAGARHWDGVYKIVLDERDALRARVAKLEAALKGARPFVNMAVTQEQAEASPRSHSKAVNALVGIDAALKDAPQ